MLRDIWDFLIKWSVPTLMSVLLMYIVLCKAGEMVGQDVQDVHTIAEDSRSTDHAD